MDDGRIAFKVHPARKTAQGVARKKCLLSASDAAFGRIAL
jgi:hypothetical protein